MKPIAVYKPETEFFTPELCYIVELHNSIEDESCSIARARVPPGVTTQLHSLRGIVERYVIIEGEGKAEVNGRTSATVRPFDVISIPAGVSQRITNIGKADLIFLCFCTPRFKTESYLDLSNQA